MLLCLLRKHFKASFSHFAVHFVSFGGEGGLDSGMGESVATLGIVLPVEKWYR